MQTTTEVDIPSLTHTPFITREDLEEMMSHVKSVEFILTRVHAYSTMNRHEDACATAYSADIYIASLKRELSALLAYGK